MKSTIRSVLAVVATALLPGAAWAQFSIDWSTIDSGGGTSSGGAFSISGTIGQPDAGGTQSGGDFDLAGGFWPGVEIVQTPGAPRLGVSRDAASGDVTVFWALPDDGFLLYRSSTLGQAPTPWAVVPAILYQTDGTKRFITIPSPTGRDFFKLFPVAPGP